MEIFFDKTLGMNVYLNRYACLPSEFKTRYISVLFKLRIEIIAVKSIITIQR